MDTVLNLGINDETVVALSKKFGERFAKDSYRRFLHMFGSVVMNIPHEDFGSSLSEENRYIIYSRFRKVITSISNSQLKTVIT